MDGSESSRLDGRTREGRAALESARAASVAAAEQQHQAVAAASDIEVITPSGKRITRENRMGFGTQSQKLAYPKRPGYFRYWANDTPGRVAGLLEGGYTHVTENGKSVTAVVGVTTTGGPLTAFLLEIPEEWRADDAEKLEDKNRGNEETIKRGVQVKDGKDAGAFYPTAQGRRISINRN